MLIIIYVYIWSIAVITVVHLNKFFNLNKSSVNYSGNKPPYFFPYVFTYNWPPYLYLVHLTCLHLFSHERHLDWLPSLIFREETCNHRHFGQGYMAYIWNTSGLLPKVFRVLWLDWRALIGAATLQLGEIMSHSHNIKFPWASVVLQNKQCKRSCVDWICPPNKSSVLKLMYFWKTAKLLFYCHQGR